jgi:hypothetical protein
MMSRKFYLWTNSLAILLWSFAFYSNTFLQRRGEATETYHFSLMTAMFPFLALISVGRIWALLTAPAPERIRDPHGTVVLQDSFVTRSIGNLFCFTMAASGFLSLAGMMPSGMPGGSLWAIAFVCIGILGLLSLFSPRLRLVLSPQGLEYSYLRPSTVPWEDVVAVTVKTVFTTSTITVTLKETTEFRSGYLLTRWHRVPRFVLNPLMFGVDAASLVDGLELRRNVFTF